jgi:tRNA (adenine22-N1)-methyltransferase
LNRIEAINSLINETDKVVDVGCDQAKLSLMLEKRGMSSIASDISEKVIEKAKKDIKSPLIDLRVSDGLSNIKKGEADTLVLSGMGTYTIIDILSKTNLRFNKIITISNNYHDILRNKMNDLNYKVRCEQIVKENNKYYNLIVFDCGKANYSETEIYLGLNHIDKKMYLEYLEYLLKKYKNIKNDSKDKNIKIDKMIELISCQIKLLK